MIIKNCYSYGNNCPCLDCERECNGCADLLSRDLSFDTGKLCALAKDYCEAVNGHKVGEQNEKTT